MMTPAPPPDDPPTGPDEPQPPQDAPPGPTAEDAPPHRAHGGLEPGTPDDIDDILPPYDYQTMPMVGLGGSAGSIQALIEFFRAMPPDTGMCFVVVLHLSPTHDSALPALLGNASTMPVTQVTQQQAVEPNHIYVIPPGKHILAADGHLELAALEPDHGKRVAVDVFFRSLADSHGPQAMAIVLSGADGDGALGVQRIKERGGLTIAQDPDRAEYASMPRSAIDTGMVDWVLEVAEMPGRLIAYRDSRARLRLPPEDGPQPSPQPPRSHSDSEAALRDVLVFLRMRTGRDFSYYKRATILRRVARRMQVNGVEDLPAYLVFLRTHPGEAGALLQDILISVTNFFRDRDVFLAVEKLVPELFRGKAQGETVRVWCPACATGEEAYSLAMLLLEHARQIEDAPLLQVFACDLDDTAIQRARAGQYPESIAADVSEDRLRRFFTKDHKGYRVRRELREMVLFASHDLLKDAPFSRMDLISCRNLLIYLNRGAQQRALDIFHFALKPGGLLLLGTSEAVEDGNPLFRVLDKKHRIYTSQPAVRGGLPLPMGTSSMLRAVESHEQQAGAAPVVHGKHFLPEVRLAFPDRLGAHLDRASLTDLHFRLIERFAPPSVLVNAEYEIMHLSDHAGEFLRFAGGEPTTNLLRVVQPVLRIDLRTALFRAQETSRPVDSDEVSAEVDGRPCLIRISVAPAADLSPGFLLVTFQRRDRDAQAPLPATRSAAMLAPEPVVRHLERELEQVKSSLRDTVEQYEASTEELKASNEELQAMNEELRSATEELETSREELQSINEELTTVNQEMKGKMDEVASANSDLQNLMASTSIATVFLDRALSITRFTPTAAGIFNMIPGDIGRPLAHLKHRLDYPELIADAAQVLRTLVPVEREVGDNDRWYLARIQPYRTVEDHIAGAVLTLVDVTERNRASEALRLSEERMRILIESAKEYAIFTTDQERRVDSWNRGAETIFGYTETEILGQPVDLLFTPEDRAKGTPAREARLARDDGRAEAERWHLRKDGSLLYASGAMMPLRERGGALRGFVEILRDLTDRKRTQEALHEQMDELTRFNTVAVGRETRMIELKAEVNELCARLGEAPRYPLDFASDVGGSGVGGSGDDPDASPRR